MMKIHGTMPLFVACVFMYFYTWAWPPRDVEKKLIMVSFACAVYTGAFLGELLFNVCRKKEAPALCCIVRRSKARRVKPHFKRLGLSPCLKRRRLDYFWKQQVLKQREKKGKVICPQCETEDTYLIRPTMNGSKVSLRFCLNCYASFDDKGNLVDWRQDNGLDRLGEYCNDCGGLLGPLTIGCNTKLPIKSCTMCFRSFPVITERVM